MARTKGTWNSAGMWMAGVALVALLALTAYAMFTGEDGGSDTPAKGEASPSVSSSSASPDPTYAVPDDWTEPDRWAALPRGQRTDDRGSEVGFPHTAEGAAAMAVTANSTVVEGETSNVDEQLGIFHSYVAATDQDAEGAEEIEVAARETDKTLARQMGVSVGQPLPAGAYVRNTVVGYQVVKQSPNEVSLWLLACVVQKNGETAKESGSYTRTLTGVQWVGGDWKMTAVATARAYQEVQGKAEPPMVAPGDAAFNTGGWTAIREVS